MASVLFINRILPRQFLLLGTQGAGLLGPLEFFGYIAESSYFGDF